ncbi:MAG: glycoside hydrolase domain-containing protein, partial [Bacteroidota bacterium]
SLFWASILPRTFSGIDGLYPSFSGERIPKRMESGQFYGDLSMWENRSSYQVKLLKLLVPNRMEDFRFSQDNEALKPSSYLKAQNLGGGKMDLGELASLEVLRFLGLKADQTDAKLFRIQLPVLNSWILNKGEANAFHFHCTCPTEEGSKILSVSLNGEELMSQEISIADILKGGELEVACE